MMLYGLILLSLVWIAYQIFVSARNVETCNDVLTIAGNKLAEGTERQVSFEEILKRYGTKDELGLSCCVGGGAFQSVANHYSAIIFDEYSIPFSRDLMSNIFKLNEIFVQIGEQGDGSAVLIKRDCDDDAIYLNDIEDGHLDKPIVIAKDFQQYILSSYETYIDSLRCH